MPCSSWPKYGSWKSRCGSTCMTTPDDAGAARGQRPRGDVGPVARLARGPPGPGAGWSADRAAVDDARDRGSRDAAQAAQARRWSAPRGIRRSEPGMEALSNIPPRTSAVKGFCMRERRGCPRSTHDRVRRASTRSTTCQARAFPDGFVVGRRHRVVPDRGRGPRGRPRREHLGSLRPHAGPRRATATPATWRATTTTATATTWRCMAELGLDAYRFSIAWPRVAARRDRRGERGGARLLRPAGRRAAGARASRPTRRSTTGTCPRPSRTPAGGRSARPPRRSPTTRTIVAAPAGRPRRAPWPPSTSRWCSLRTSATPTGSTRPGARTGRAVAGRGPPPARRPRPRRWRRSARPRPRLQAGIVLNFEPHAPGERRTRSTSRPRPSRTTDVQPLVPGPARRRRLPGATRRGRWGWDRDEVLAGDMATIAAPLDFLGVNYYTPDAGSLAAPAAARPPRPTGADRDGLGGLSGRAHRGARARASRTGDLPLYVTRTGPPIPLDPADPTRDPDRVSYLARHLAAALDAIEHGVPLRGYFVWSLLDNFEWAEGYAQRFGIVHVDFETQERRVRDSGRFLGAWRVGPRDGGERRPPPSASARRTVTRRPADAPVGRARSPGRTGRPARPAVLWRSARNPIIPRDQLPRSNSIFNSAVVPFADGFAGRLPGRRHRPHDEPPRRAQRRRRDLGDRRRSRSRSSPADDRVAEIQGTFEHAYDPRVTWLEDRFYVTWCNGYHGPTIGIAWTTRLRDVPPARQRVPAVQPQRRAVPAPHRRRLRDAEPAERQRPHAVRRHLLLGEPRPGPLGPPSPRHGARALDAGTRPRSAPGPTPIETAEGWLLIYHGVLTSCNGFVYSMGAALLDLDEPWQVIARGRATTCSRPQVPYEQVGDVPNVVFPCAALVDATADRLTVYYGGRRHGRVHGPRPPLGAAGVPARRRLSAASAGGAGAAAAPPAAAPYPRVRATNRPIRSRASPSFS